jgi:hypothetical protein
VHRGSLVLEAVEVGLELRGLYPGELGERVGRTPLGFRGVRRGHVELCAVAGGEADRLLLAGEPRGEVGRGVGVDGHTFTHLHGSQAV